MPDSTPKMQVTLSGCQEGLAALQAMAQDIGTYACLDKIRLNRIVLAMDELFANIHEHGYRLQGGKVECTGRCIEKDQQLYQLEIIMRDYAPVLENLDGCQGVCPETLKDNPVAGGLGMGLIQTITQRFEHTALEDGNQWLMLFDVQSYDEDKKSGEV